ncbi:putative dihydrofolate synthetase [Paramyrothecium foliicola]|nr:putative dihydrofolate synthetase [Paramyrothecium foliicola]
MVSRNDVSAALNRIRAVITRRALLRDKHGPQKRQRPDPSRDPEAKAIRRIAREYPEPTTPQHRNIRLGLDRIVRVAPSRQTWKGVHVTGTNGKGSICAFLAGLFKLSGLSFGTFTSPAFPERHNAVTINGLYVNKRMFDAELRQVESRSKTLLSRRWLFENPKNDEHKNASNLGDITPFEADTATAFHVFNKMRVGYGIVEVGMGGATDATNVMQQKSVTVISKIDLDHQEYLGDTIRKIAKVKAGIMRKDVPCVLDYTNSQAVISEVMKHAGELKTWVSLSNEALPFLDEIDTTRFKLEEYQKQNLLCALLAFRKLFPEQPIDVNKLLALDPFMPGRLEKVGVEGLSGGQRREPVLVDGAHNMLGIESLAKHVDNNLREGDAPVTWVMGISAGPSKPFAAIIEKLLRPQDNVAFIEFEQGPTDPSPASVQAGREIASTIITSGAVYDGEPNVYDAMQWACGTAAGGPLVVTGSLYLIRDFFKLPGLERTRGVKSRNPGRSQLYQYVTLHKRGLLDAEELREFKRARRHWYLSPNGITRRRYEENTGETEWPPKVSDEVAELQQKADHHEQQANAYEQALLGLQKDIDRGVVVSKQLEDGSSTSFQTYVQDLKKQYETHAVAFDDAAGELKKHSILRYRKSLVPKKVPGRRRRGIRIGDNPFMAYPLARPPNEEKTSQRRPPQRETKAPTQPTAEPSAASSLETDEPADAAEEIVKTREDGRFANDVVRDNAQGNKSS